MSMVRNMCQEQILKERNPCGVALYGLFFCRGLLIEDNAVNSEIMVK